MDTPTEITSEDIQEIAGVVPDSVIRGFASTLGVDIKDPSDMDIDVNGKSGLPAHNFDQVRSAVRELMKQGYSAAQLLSQVRVSNYL